jgi:hypothetical protein
MSSLHSSSHYLSLAFTIVHFSPSSYINESHKPSYAWLFPHKPAKYPNTLKYT